MLKLKGIKKTYVTDAGNVDALRGIDLEFRKSEFVSILGQSGCGKTTLLNIIGGLDKYTDGDLVIKGKSTKKYNDHDWDAYRNHSVGFVFQSYNLIPHQTILANVELALTLSGVSKSERRKRAVEALEKVGLGDQITKRPNQLSGGQMQRVAIARAIVNDPEILLADEPTGALDSETSVAVMEILREIAADRLVIMVTHNPDLAEKYSTRIISVRDGLVTGDTMPYDSETEKGEETDYKLIRNKSMSFFTALGLSVNNLLTKKGRTIMTCFAGSIGIIGIALILSVSNGVNRFINKVQEETLAKYPLTIESETVDLAAMLQAQSEKNEKNYESRDPDRVYAGNNMSKMIEMMATVPTSKNNVKDFKHFIDGNKEFTKHTSAIKYSYPVRLNLYSKDENDKIVKADSEELIKSIYGSMGISFGSDSSTGSLMSMYSSAFSVWEEMLSGEDGELVNPMLKEQYDVVYGHWPENENEVILILDGHNELNDFVLYTLGLKSSEELGDLLSKVMQGEDVTPEEMSWSYEELCNLKFKLINSCDYYKKIGDVYVDMTATEENLKMLYNNPDCTEIKIAGIVKPNEDALFNMLSGSIGYTSALTEKIIRTTAENELVKAQLADKNTDALTGLPFRSSVKAPEDPEKIAKVKEYFASLTNAKKAEIFIAVQSVPTNEYLEQSAAAYMTGITREQIVETVVKAYSESMGTADTDSIRGYIDAMSDDDLNAMFAEQVKKGIAEQYAAEVAKQFSAMPADNIAAMFDAAQFTDEQYVSFYDEYVPQNVSDSDYDLNMAKLGYIDIDEPNQIIIYASTFNEKNEVSDIIDEYNETVSEENKIKVTDYVKLLMSSVSTVINAISYVLIAFVGISLVVSSIMIGVITNISVLERTKEIGILRAVGASKRDVGSVFNAETFIIGLLAGVIGIAVTLILIVPINIILHALTDIEYLSASLPIGGAIFLVILSTVLTLIAGLIPAKSASNKDPVVALRSE